MRLCIAIISSLIYLSGLTACVSTAILTPLADEEIIAEVEDSFPTLDPVKFGGLINVEPEDQVFKLSDQQIKDFLKYYNKITQREVSGHIKVYEYLKDIGDRFTYDDQTNNAETTLRTASGNCMSLAVLTTALARLVNIEIKYELVNRVPIYQEYGSVIFNAQHIRSIIYEPLNDPGTGVQVFRSKAVIDYYPSRYSYASGFVSRNKFIGMYYQNLAAEALGKDDYQSTFWLLEESLANDVDNADAINTMAVLHRRAGEVDKAEALFKYGIKEASNKITLLRNYQVFLRTQDRLIDAERVAKELEGLEDLNPFGWLLAANEAYAESDHTTALTLYKKAIELAPYLHQGYLGIAKIEYSRGNFSAANKALVKAREEAFDEKARTLYDAKLEALSRERFN